MERIEQKDSKSFSASRFMALLKADFILNKNSYLKYAIAIIGCYVAIAALISFNAASNIRDVTEINATNPFFQANIDAIRSNYSGMLFFLSLFLMALFMTIKGSQTFSNLIDKKHRISAFMLPASMSEKFFLRMSIYLVGGTLFSIFGIFAALMVGQITFKAGSFAIGQIKDFFDNVDCAAYIVVILVLMMLFQNAVFTLGSALWPKLSWVKTWIVLTVIQWIFGFGLIILNACHVHLYPLLQKLDNIEPQTLCWLVIIIEVILIAACWFFAWKRFRSTQIVQRFMKK